MQVALIQALLQSAPKNPTQAAPQSMVTEPEKQCHGAEDEAEEGDAAAAAAVPVATVDSFQVSWKEEEVALMGCCV